MYYNIKMAGREDFMLGCSVRLPETALYWLKYYTTRYPGSKFEIVKTDDAGDMVGVSISDFLHGRR